LRSVWVRSNCFVRAAVRITPSHEKWPTEADPFFQAQRYTLALTEAVQPPDDRTYSAEVTVFRRNLLHHRIARIRIPYTRLNNITWYLQIVKHNFRKNHKETYVFSVILQKLLFRAQQQDLQYFFNYPGHRLRFC